MIQAFRSRQFLAFVLVGGLAAVVNFGSRMVYSRWLDFSSAIVLAYVTGMCTAFVLNRWLVFAGRQGGLLQSWVYFCLVNLVAVAQTWLVTMALAEYLLPGVSVESIQLHRQEIGHAVGIMVPVFTSYLGHKRWSFRAA